MAHTSNPRYFIGLMSGTSADGVDAALIECANSTITLVDFVEQPLPTALKAQLIELNQNPTLSLEDLCQLEHDVAMQFIGATQTLLAKAGFKPQDITAIGSHGQTLFHAPSIPMSLQIGHPAFIAKQTGIDTVADFRVDDLAVGGQGAPLAPSFHQQLFLADQATYVVNIGGIANVSYLNTHSQALYGFDTGPGNALMDEICQKQFACAFDRNGEIAQSGKIQAGLLKQLLEHPYFNDRFPKSTGRETFNSAWLTNELARYSTNVSSENVLTTLCELTAQSIQLGIKQLATELGAPNGNVWIVGGGAYNPYLIERIQNALPDYRVQSSLEANINPNAIEAMMCGWLAQQRIDKKPIPLTAITGADRNVVLGGLWSAK